MGASPTLPTLQPEAIGAVMEVTKWLKPSGSVSRIGEPRLPLWVKSEPQRRARSMSGVRGRAEEILMKADIRARTSGAGGRAVVPTAWPGLRLIAKNGHAARG